jgi:carbonic anhydrase
VRTFPHFPLLNHRFAFPACNEAVTWLVSKDPIPIYQSELNLLQQMEDDHNERLSYNNRPVQDLNGRQLIKNFE